MVYYRRIGRVYENFAYNISAPVVDHSDSSALSFSSGSSSGNSNQIKQYAILNIKEIKEEVVTDPGTPDKVETKLLTAKSTKTNGFAVGKYKLSNR